MCESAETYISWCTLTLMQSEIYPGQSLLILILVPHGSVRFQLFPAPTERCTVLRILCPKPLIQMAK